MAEIQTAVVNALTDPAVSKIPYTDGGILVVKGAVLGALRKFESPRGAAFFVGGSSVVNAPRAADVPEDERKRRVLSGLGSRTLATLGEASIRVP